MNRMLSAELSRSCCCMYFSDLQPCGDTKTSGCSLTWRLTTRMLDSLRTTSETAYTDFFWIWRRKSNKIAYLKLIQGRHIKKKIYHIYGVMEVDRIMDYRNHLYL